MWEHYAENPQKLFAMNLNFLLDIEEVAQLFTARFF